MAHEPRETIPTQADALGNLSFHIEIGEKLSNAQSITSAHCYAFIRLLELQCAWLPLVKDSEFKIFLGHRIGYDANYLSILSNRLASLLSPPVFRAPTQAYADNFNRAAQFIGEIEIATFLGECLSDIKHSMENYLRQSDPLGDEPSVRILKSIIPQIEQEIIELCKFRTRGAAFAFSEIGLPVEGSGVTYCSKEPLPELCNIPNRPDGVILTEENTLSHKNDDDLINSRECMLRFLHYVYFDVEINAMEICARNICEFREMPLEFKLDMAQQIWDEARHAKFFINKLRELGGREGMYPIRMTVWNRYLTGSTLQERLAVEQIVQEGNSVETNMAFAKTLRAHGLSEMADSFDLINADEAVHARIGNRWLLRLCNNSQEKYLAYIRAAAKAIKWNIPGKSPLNPNTRLLSGFPAWFTDAVRRDAI